jgi:hypothetical protein
MQNSHHDKTSGYGKLNPVINLPQRVEKKRTLLRDWRCETLYPPEDILWPEDILDAKLPS